MSAPLKFLKVLLLLTAGYVTSYGQVVEKTTSPVRLTLKDTSPPEIKLLYKNNGALTRDGKVEVTISVRDQSDILSVSIDNEMQPVPNGQDSVTYAKIFAPDHEVLVRAKDKFNNVKERSLIIRGQAPQPAATSLASELPVRKNYMLLIAEQEYGDPTIASLSEPFKDALSLKDLLVKKYTFNENEISLLKNPTYEEIEIEFERLSRVVTANDNLLLFYAGHGFFDEKTNIGYWLPSDAQSKNKARWFRNSALVENIGAINAKHTLLIADACFSGSIFKTRAPFNNGSIDIANMMKRPSRKAMTSGSLSTVPDKSMFMKYLIKSLTENNNKYLPSEDLFDEVRISLKSNSDIRPLYGEIKDVGDEGGNFVFILRD
ncbi:MAG: caspase family protein [Bacteroidetes bacterium]|nr:caspase family protein [Bacteroidota bacterium]MBS1541803.1 caspase family protein [Bacteroidota bacterium]